MNWLPHGRRVLGKLHLKYAMCITRVAAKFRQRRHFLCDLFLKIPLEPGIVDKNYCPAPAQDPIGQGM